MSPAFSVCGCDCSICPSFRKSECRGCSEIEGNVWWARHVSAAICPVYHCVINEKKFEHCGACPELPCKLWRDLKDPSFTDEQHEAGIRERIGNLGR